MKLGQAWAWVWAGLETAPPTQEPSASPPTEPPTRYESHMVMVPCAHCPPSGQWDLERAQGPQPWGYNPLPTLSFEEGMGMESGRRRDPQGVPGAAPQVSGASVSGSLPGWPPK